MPDGPKMTARCRLALGTLALGTLALGTLALGTLALGRLALRLELESFLDHLAIILASSGNHFGIIWQSFWHHLAIMLGSNGGRWAERGKLKVGLEAEMEVEVD